MKGNLRTFRIEGNHRSVGDAASRHPNSLEPLHAAAIVSTCRTNQDVTPIASIELPHLQGRRPSQLRAAPSHRLA